MAGAGSRRQRRGVEIGEQLFGSIEMADQKEAADLQVAGVGRVDAVAASFEREARAFQRLFRPGEITRDQSDFGFGHDAAGARHGLARAEGMRHTADKLLLVVSSLVIADTIIRNVIFVFVVPSYGGHGDFISSQYAFAMQASTSILALMFALSALAATTVDTIAMHRDIAERDPMTGMLNRRGFDRMVAERGRAEGSVIICDIDNFKWVNDTLGHGPGDEVIRAFAEMLLARMPEGGFAARFGGEEFVIFLPAMPLAAGADFANRVRLAFAAVDRKASGFDGKITASFGVAGADAADHSLYEQIARADKALYAAKEAGRNKVMVEGEPPRDMGIDGQRIADLDWKFEGHFLDRRRDDAAPCALGGADAACKVHLRHDPAAENIAGRIGVPGHGKRTQGKFACRLGIGHQGLPSRR